MLSREAIQDQAHLLALRPDLELRLQDLVLLKENKQLLEMESLCYDIDTGVREGSILPPLLHILFIDGLLAKLRKSGS